MLRCVRLWLAVAALASAGCQVVLGIEDVSDIGDACEPSEVQTLATAGEVGRPVIARSGDIVAMAWRQDGEIVLAQLDAQGRVTQSPTPTLGDNFWDVRLAPRQPGNFALVAGNHDINGQHHIFFYPWDTQADTLGDIAQISDGSTESQDARLAWTGTEYGVAWRQGNHMAFARVAPDGAVLHREDLDDDTPLPRVERVLWTGEQYAVLWRRDFAFQLSRFDGEGAPLGSSELGAASSMDIAWTGEAYALVTGDDRTVELHTLDAAGMDRGPTLLLADSLSFAASSVRIAGYGSGHAVTWLEGGDSDVQLVTIDQDGAVSETQTLAMLGDSSGVDVVWSGRAYLVAWHHGGAQGVEVLRVCP